jgi:predicted TIM-barrel fold metal-dependent hydrolase
MSGLSAAIPKHPEFVDAHVHVFPPEMVRGRESFLDRDNRFGELYRSPSARMVTAAEVVESMDNEGVSLSVIAGFPFADQGLCRFLNDYVLEAAASQPGRLVGLASVAPAVPGAVTELERCLDAGLRGCGELAPEHADELGEVASCLRERGAPLLVHGSEPVGHSYPGKGRFGPDCGFALAAANPGLTIVLAHFGGGLFLYESMPEVRETLRDVYYDTAAAPYLYGAGIYQALRATAGVGKVIFGSDYPLLAPGRYQPALAELSPEEQEVVREENARKVFKL